MNSFFHSQNPIIRDVKLLAQHCHCFLEQSKISCMSVFCLFAGVIVYWPFIDVYLNLRPNFT